MVNWTEVCEQHRGLVFTIARRYLGACIHDPAIDLDDLMQTGYIGLMEAAQTHDESKGSFAHWAVYYIRYEIRLMLSMHRKLPRIRMFELSLDAPVMDGEDPTLGDAVAADVDIETDTDQQELVQAVQDAVDQLPEQQRALVRLCDLQERSLSDAARACNTSLPSAQNTHKSALKTLFFDENLRELAIAHELDKTTDWHRHVGAANYRSTWVSSTEALVFQREDRRQKLMKRQANLGPRSGAEKHF